MRDTLASMFEELFAIFSGRFVAYHRLALLVSGVTALVFSLVFSHTVVFNGGIAVIDLDVSRASARLIERVNASSYLEVRAVVRSPADAARLTAHDRFIGALYIPKGMEKDLTNGTRPVRLGYLADYSNSSQNAQAIEALNEILPEFGAEFVVGELAAAGLDEEGVEAAMRPLSAVTRVLFNPTLSSTSVTAMAFITFFSSLYLGITTLMLVGRLKVTGLWQGAVLRRGPGALMARLVPYAFLYATAISVVTAILYTCGQLRFAGNYFSYALSLFMTGMAFGLFALIMSWGTSTPSAGSSLLTLLVPPGFIMGGALMATGFLPRWAWLGSHLFPLVWQFKFYRDFALRGESTLSMLPVFGAYGALICCFAALVTLLFYRAQSRARRDAGDASAQ